MLDFEKLCFNSVSDEYLPIQVLFEYSRESTDIEKFLLYGVGEDDVPEDDEIESIEFELFIFSMDDFKVECTLHGTNGDYFIGNYIESMHNAFEWLEQIPDNELNQIKETIKKAKGAQ